MLQILIFFTVFWINLRNHLKFTDEYRIPWFKKYNSLSVYLYAFYISYLQNIDINAITVMVLIEIAK